MRRPNVGVVATLVMLTTIVAIDGEARAFPSGGALAPPLTLVISIAGSPDVPIDAKGVALNVTVTNPVAAGFLTVYPCGDRPVASNLNYVANQTVPNFVVTALSPAGEVCIDTFAVVDVVVDLAGYLPSTSPIVTLDQPLRIVDSRQGLGLAGRMNAGDVAAVQIDGANGVPADAAMVLFNVTAVDTGAPGFLTVFPCGEAIPPTSTLNFAANAIVPNFVVSRVGLGGQVCVYSFAATDVLVDVAGYVPSGSDIVPLQQPDRLLDTRFGIGGPVAKLTPAGRALQLAGVGALPPTATAVIVNLTAAQAGANGFVSAFPCGGATPTVSNLNVTPNRDVANLAIVKLSADGQLCFGSNTVVDVIADITGYLTADTSITVLAPTRIYDSRDNLEPPCNLGLIQVLDGFQVVDLANGAPIVILHVDNLQFPRAYVRADCQTIDVVGNISLTGQPLQYWWWQFSPSGTLLAAQQLPPTDLAEVMFTDVGPIVLRQVPVPTFPVVQTAWQIIDMTTGQTLFSLQDVAPATNGSFRPWRAVGSTPDGSLVALRFDSADRTASVINFFTPTGLLLGQWTTPAGALDVRISPAATYLSYVLQTPTNLPGAVTFDEYVVTLAGDPIAKLPGALWFGPTFHDAWISDGAIMGCIIRFGPGAPSGQRAGRWDLFSPLKPLIASDPTLPCLEAAG